MVVLLVVVVDVAEALVSSTVEEEEEEEELEATTGAATAAAATTPFPLSPLPYTSHSHISKRTTHCTLGATDDVQQPRQPLQQRRLCRDNRQKEFESRRH